MNSAAYDLSRYEMQPEPIIQKHERPQAVPARPGVPGGSVAIVIAVVFFCLCAVMACVYSHSRISEVHADVQKAKAELVQLEQENTRMIAAIEEKSSQKAVEEYAVKVLGMQKLERSQTEYVSIESGNHAEVSENEETVFEKIADTFEKLVSKE
ncbi:MAG: cell division protein FtsL [Oscillospiraceae bacterium]|nr:cell division protein FtsL [Oscillospiraceae bacterium]